MRELLTKEIINQFVPYHVFMIWSCLKISQSLPKAHHRGKKKDYTLTLVLRQPSSCRKDYIQCSNALNWGNWVFACSDRRRESVRTYHYILSSNAILSRANGVLALFLSKCSAFPSLLALWHVVYIHLLVLYDTLPQKANAFVCVCVCASSHHIRTV